MDHLLPLTHHLHHEAIDKKVLMPTNTIHSGQLGWGTRISSEEGHDRSRFWNNPSSYLGRSGLEGAGKQGGPSGVPHLIQG